MTTRLHPLPHHAVTVLVEACVEQLVRAGLAAADVVTAARVFERILRRARVGVDARPGSNGHQHPHDPRARRLTDADLAEQCRLFLHRPLDDDVRQRCRRVIVTGTLAAATERTVGQSGPDAHRAPAGRRPDRDAKGSGEQADTIPVTIWNDDRRDRRPDGLPAGTPLTVIGKLTSREWNNRLYLELVADHVAVDVAAQGEVREAAPTAQPSAAPARVSGERSTAREKSDVPF